MAVSTRREEVQGDDAPAVSVHETTPDRVVFTESGNWDGWIATDLTVSLDR